MMLSIINGKWNFFDYLVYPYKAIDAIYGQPQFSLKIYQSVLTIEYLSVYRMSIIMIFVSPVNYTFPNIYAQKSNYFCIDQHIANKASKWVSEASV